MQVFSNSQGFTRSQEIKRSGGCTGSTLRKTNHGLPEVWNGELKGDEGAQKDGPWHQHQKPGQLTQWEGTGQVLMEGIEQILGTAWGPCVVHSGPQRHSTGGLPHFQVAGWRRGASLLLARSKTKWPLTASNVLQSTWPWELLFTSNACFYLHFLQS